MSTNVKRKCSNCEVEVKEKNGRICTASMECRGWLAKVMKVAKGTGRKLTKSIRAVRKAKAKAMAEEERQAEILRLKNEQATVCEVKKATSDKTEMYLARALADTLGLPQPKTTLSPEEATRNMHRRSFGGG